MRKGYNGNMKEIEEMIKQDIENGKATLHKAIEEKRNVREKLEREGKSLIERITGWDGRTYAVLNKEYQEVIDKYRYYLKLAGNYGSKGAEQKIEQDIKDHYKTLQAKVEKKIGKIIKVEHLGGYDYRFEGENGNCGVEVIIAGGYNIQRRHTRWIITK